MINNLFCYAPWSNLEILPSGEILPCCKFQTNSQDTFNIKQHSIQDFRNSQTLTSVKKDFLQGKWPQGCDRCRIEEASGIESKRILDYARWKEHYDLYDLSSNSILTVSVAFGNVCNLKCIICNPLASSKWQKEYFDVYNVKFESMESIRKTIVKSIHDIAPDLVHADIHGGEPLLSGIDEHRNFLDYYINSGKANTISIHYTTNGTLWPEKEWFDRWQHFKEIDLQLSIDGIGGRYEYLRYPANWSTVENNVRQYVDYEKLHLNFRLSVAHTVSAYNIYYLDEFVDWCKNIGLPKPWMGKLHKPNFMRPSVWPTNARDAIIHRLDSSKHTEVQQWAKLITNTDDSNLFDEFKEKMQIHDQYRLLNFAKTFPEMAKYL